MTRENREKHLWCFLQQPQCFAPLRLVGSVLRVEFDSVSVSSQVHLEEVQEEELITVDAVGCFEGEEEEEEEVEVADEEEAGGVKTEEKVLEVRANVQEPNKQTD